MRLLVDLRGCHFHQERGIPNYAIGLAKAIAREGRVTCSFLVRRSRPQLLVEADLRALGQIIFEEDLVTLGVPGGCDAVLLTSVMHDLAGDGDLAEVVLPPEVLAHRPIVCAILYDLIPLIYPNHYLPDVNVRSRYELLARSFRHFDHTFCISEATAADASTVLGLPRGAVSVIYAGVDRERWRPPSPSPVRDHSVVYVGGDDYRKNLDATIIAFGRHLRSGPSSLDLSIICNLSSGSRHRLEALIRSIGCEGRVHLLGILPQDELVERVARARASIFPSLYEGLGLPVLESYLVGTPVFGSSSSSLKEIIHPSCQFDPADIASIADAFEAIDVDEQARSQSLLHGQYILARFSWDGAARQVVGQIVSISMDRSPPAEFSPARVAIVTPLAPQQTGVGIFSARAFSASEKSITFVSSATNEGEASDKYAAIEGDPQRIEFLDHTRFRRARPSTNYQGVVFVLGNSPHAVPELRAAQAFREVGTRKLLYLHEARVTGLLLAYYGGDLERLAAAMSEVYPELRSPAYRDPWSVLNSHALGTRVLFDLVGDCELILNSERARQLIHRDRGGHGKILGEHVLFHPAFPVRRPTPSTAKDGVLRLGHFGILGPMKRPDLLLEVAEMLARIRPVSLTLAGYDVKRWFTGRVPEFVRLVDSPGEADLLQEMVDVDVALQPREPDHGESSGVVHQLIALGKRPVTSGGTSADELAGLVRLVPPGSSPKVWCDVALQEAAASQPSRSELVGLSVETFSRRFDKIFDDDCPPHHSAQSHFEG